MFFIKNQFLMKWKRFLDGNKHANHVYTLFPKIINNKYLLIAK